MQAIVRLYSVFYNEIEKFLRDFYGENNFEITSNSKQWQKEYPNPIEIADIVSAYAENIDSYNLTMWVSIDSGIFIKITKDNVDEFVKYLYERFPY